MKIFTKSVLVAIAMMAGVTTATAQDWQNSEEWVELVPEARQTPPIVRLTQSSLVKCLPLGI